MRQSHPSVSYSDDTVIKEPVLATWMTTIVLEAKLTITSFYRACSKLCC
ncbi:hypothetical protein [Wolbachia endosymbiont of Cardiocondyla obscurior]|nr:hypothetical protein [Wolbachia endosymbiont of Cardiocondyla obscurior]